MAMATLSPSSYSENLSAVAAVAVGLQQSVGSLYDSIAQLMQAVDGATEALSLAGGSFGKTEHLLQDLQAAFRRSGLDVGESNWMPHRPPAAEKALSSITGCHGTVREHLKVCSQQLDQLMSIVGKHLLLVNFSAPAQHTDLPHTRVADTKVPVISAQRQEPHRVAGQTGNTDYSEDVAVVKASLLTGREGEVSPAVDRLQSSRTSVSEEGEGYHCQAIPVERPRDEDEPQESNGISELVSAEAPRTPVAIRNSTNETVPLTREGPVAHSSAWYESPEVNNVGNTEEATDVSLYVQSSSGRLSEAVCDTNGYGQHTAKPMPGSPLAGAPTGIANSVPNQENLTIPTDREEPTPTADATALANGGLTFFDATPASAIKKKPRLSSEGLRRTSSKNPATGTGAKSPLSRVRSTGARLAVTTPKEVPRSSGDGREASDSCPDSGSSTLDRTLSAGHRASQRRIPKASVTPTRKLSRAGTDESGDEKKTSPGSFRRRSDVNISKSASASPRTKSPMSRSISGKSSFGSKSPSSSSLGNLATAETSSMVSPPVQRRNEAQVSSEVRHLVAVKEGASPLGLKICGGRGTGVFVDTVAPGSVSSACGLQIGDQILKFGDNNFSCITHCAAGHSMLGLNGEIKIEARHNPKGYEGLPKGRDSQDYFHIRTRFSRPADLKKNVQDLPMSTGDVFLVTETMPRSRSDCWKAHPVAVANGTAKDKSGLVPSRRRILDSVEDQGDEEPLLVYEAVELVKCECPRPVVLLGAPQIVASLRTQLLKDHDDIFCACPVYDVMGQIDMTSRSDVILLTNVHDASRQTFVYKTSVEQASEKGLHCLLDVSAADIPSMIDGGQYPIVVLLLKNRPVVAAKEEYGLSWLLTGNITLSNVARRDSQAILRTVADQQKHVVWAPHPCSLTDSNA